MKKNLLFLCLMLLLASVSGFAQGPTTVTIGTGTNDSYNLPINNYYKNSWSEMIYPASQITETGYITSIGFDVSSVAVGYLCNTITIYMGVTSNEAHNSNSDWLPMEALTEVYSSIDWPLPTATGWLAFELDNPFPYSGDNLVIVISKTMPNYTNALKFRYTEGATNCCLYRRNDNDLSYASHPGANTGTLTNQLPNLQLTFSTTTDFCHAVTNFAVTDISAYEATFAWNAPEDASNYILQYTEYEDWESGDVVTVYPTETPYTLTNLVPNTRYNVRVANVCDNEYSSWRYTAFKTECVTISIAEAPYFEMFEGYTNYAFPDCWTRITGYTSGSTYYPAINNNNAFSGTGSLDLYGNADNPNVVALPQFVEDLNTLRLSFWMKPSSTNNNFLELGVMTDLTDNSTFTLLHSWSAAEIGSTNWAYYEMNLDTMNTPASGHLVFRQHIESGNYFCYLDDVRVMPIPACETPTGLAVAYVHTYSADLVWDNMSGTYNIYYKADTEDDYSSVNNVMVTDNGYELGNLAPETTYHVYVAAVCEDGSEAPSSSSVIFTTLCAHETTPYSEDFNASNSIPNCWEKFTGLVSDAFAGVAPTPTSSGWNFNNTHVFGQFHPKVNIYGTNCRYWLVSPAIDLSNLEDPALTFDLALTAYNNSNPPGSIGEDDRFLVLISTDDGATWSADNAIEWNITGTADYALNQIPAIGDEMIISLAQYAGQTIRIAFYGESTVSGGDIDLHIDNVAVTEFPSCPKPAQLQASNVTTHSAEISWVEKGNAASWAVEYGPAGFTPGNGTVITVDYYPTTILYELTPSTDYEVHVKADCGVGEFSDPKSVAFRTADCETLTLPYTEDFESYTTRTTASTGIAPACWELVQEDVAMTDATRPQLYYKNTFANSGNYSLKMGYRGIYAMPELSENIETKHVHLEMYLRQANGSYWLQAGVWEDDGTFVPVATFKNSTTDVEFVECDFANYTGSGRRIAFRNVTGNGTHYDYSYNYIDDITLTESTLIPASLPYYTDFSENTDQNWRLKNGSCVNYWMMGTPDEDTPSALFVTQDGAAAGYNIDNSSTVMAEKAFHMPASDFVHVEFDVQVGGQNYIDYLKVFLTSVEETFDAGEDYNTQSYNTYSENALDFSDYKSLTGYTYYPYMLNLTNGNTLHISANMPNPHPNEIGKIVFLWRNNNYTGTQPGAVIKNFSIEEIEEILPPTVTTADISFIRANTATCGGNVTDNNSFTVTERGVCWSTAPNPTLDDAYIVSGNGMGEFTCQLTDLTQGTTYYVRAFATNAAGTAYGEEVSFTACDPIVQLPYTEDFEFYTEETTTVTGVEPTCWELVQEDVPMTDANRPQLYYNSDYANSGSYSLRLNYRGIYAMPRMEENTAMNHVHLEMYLRQPRSYYALEVGVWEDDGSFTPVATFNNSTTEVEHVECDFANYTGNGRRIAFRNIPGSNDVYNYSYNYIDDIMLNDISLIPVTIPYYTDFSENSDQNWRLENGVCTNYWMMGSPDENTPSALFVTQDGSTAGYSISKGSTVMAEKAFLMPADDYVHVEFDMLAGGESRYDYLKVFLTPVDEMFDVSTANNTQSNYSYSINALDFSDYKPLTGNNSYPYILNLTNGNTLHVNANMPNPIPNGTGKIVFLWRNDNSSGTQPGVVISNFSIEEAVFLPPTVTTGYIDDITSNSAYCYSEVTDNGGITVTDCGVCWSTTPNPTLEDGYYVYSGNSLGEFTSQLTGLTQGTTYYVRAFATNAAGTAYGEEISFSACDPFLQLPYMEDFESYTEDTTAVTGVELPCWELVQEDVPMTDENRPQLYYKNSYANSGDYSLRLNYRGVYAMPRLLDGIALKHVHLEMYLRQPRSYYALEVGVWEDDDTFVPVTTFNNSTTGMQHVECDFSNYTGNGRRIAFRNLNTNGNAYSYNYLDDITVTETEGCEITFEMQDSYGDGWNGNKILIHNDGTEKEVTLTSGHEGTATVMVHNGSLDFEWVNGSYTNECSFTVTGPSCLYHEGSSMSPGVFYSTWMDCESGLPSVPDFTYWTENTCNSVIVHFENNSANAISAVWDFGDGATSEEYSPTHEYTWDDTYQVTLSVFNNTCENAYSIIQNVEMTMPERLLLPYSEDFESYTSSTTPSTGVEPTCWELVLEDVPMSDANRPQLYYKSSYAHSGNYSLMLNYRGVYAMPALAEYIDMSQIHLEMYLRQPKAYYALEVGVWEDDTFVPVATFNNSTTGVELVECDFSEYSGYSHRIAFRNLNTNGDAYSYNYLDDITLTYAIPAGDAQPCPGHETVTDYDGNVYNTVQIGEQCWMKENLRVTHYEDGMEIPFADYNSLSYDFNYRYAPNGDINNVSVYGYLYNWAAVMHGNVGNNNNPSIVQGVCPQGWHLPSNAEWTQLTDYVSSVSAYLCDGNPSYITKALASQDYWLNSSLTCSAGDNQQESNATGFSAVPAGYIGEGLGYGCFGTDASFWSCSNYNYYRGISRRIWSGYSGAMYYDINLTKSFGLAVRCVLGDGYNLAAVTTDWANATSSNSAVCFGNVTYDGNTAVTECGVCWSTEPNPTLANAHTSEGGGTGVFTSTLTNLTEGATYYVRAYATNNMGTVYGDNVMFTTCGGTLTLPYTENFDYYTVITTPATGIEPACWELVQEDVPMSDANRPQLYYKSAYAHSGNYSLMLNYRGVYAMPSLSEDIPMNQVHLEMYLRQPRAYYALEVGVWENDGTFVPVTTFNNSTTEVTRVECDFSEYIGDGHRIAFRNLNTNGDAYGYNYLDDITLKFAIPAGDAKPCPGHETVTDYDGNVYNTVKIGEQCWMKENLRVTKYEDGKEIPLGDANTTSYDISYRYAPNGDINNVSVYGYLYNWAAVMHGNAGNNDNPGIVQGICPQGWHMPSDAEWYQLTDYVSNIHAYMCGEDYNNIAQSLTATTGWNSYDGECTVGYDPSTNNATGFSAQPAGYYEAYHYHGFGMYANIWSCTNEGDYDAWYRYLDFNKSDVTPNLLSIARGKSVRCVLGEGYNLAAVTTNWVNTISSSSAICGGNVTYEGNTTVTERGVCWSFEPNPTLANEYTIDGSGSGEFTTQLTDLWESTTYYVRAYATNSMGTVYGEEVSFTTCGGTIALPYSETFENYTGTTATTTGIEPACWELVQEDVAMPDNKRPQLYYKSSFAHSGNYSLMMNYRGVYAMPPIEENMAMKHVHLGMYLRQPNAAYRLQVGVWDDETGTFTPVTTFNNSTTEVEFVECDFSDYTGNGRRVAFRNVLASGANYSYSYNYIDDIILTETEGCELTIEMHSQDWSWDGSYIRVHTDGSVKEVTLNGGYEETVNVTVHNGTLDLEWVNGWWPEACSFTVSGLPCLYYSTETAPTEGVFYNTEINCDGDNTTAIPDFSYWTENACNSVIVHFENNSTDADYFVWDFGDWNTSEEWAPAHEYTEGAHLVTLSANNGSCEDFSVIKKYIDVYMPEPITTHLDTAVCAAELPLTWYGQEITHGGIYSTTLQTVTGCDSTVYMNFNLLASTFAHTPDTIVSANEPVTLWAAGSGDFIWTDADGNVIGEGNNITVIPTENTTYYVTKPGENLIQGNFVNGDFEQGNTGFSTQYYYSSYGNCGGYYIGNNSYYWNSGYGYTADHTTGSGLFMMVDATSYSNIWSQTINVTPHTNYTFSAWFLTLSYANISYYVNGENITNFDFIETGNIWEPHSGTWYSGDNTTATISINTEWADCGGYDFGLDDIMFYSGSCSSTESITLTLLPTGDAQPCPGIPTMTDYDGNVYNTVKIGNQCWMKENLKTTHYADGIEIALGEETSLSIPYRYAPGYDWEDHSYNVDAYGYLYNWAAVMNGTNSSAANPSGVQGVCPDGWHVPSNAEWVQLTDYLSSEPVYQCDGSNDIANALIFPEGWSWWWDNECNPGYSSENTTGFNTTGFSIRPAGSYDGDYTITINGNYYDFSSHAAFWSSTKSNTRNAWGIQLYCNNANVYRYYFNKGNGFSVRCVYNEAIAAIPTVETGEVMFITPTYATCGGNVTNDGGATVTERGICWSTEHSPTLEDNSIIDGTGTGEWQTLLSDLTESTIYYVRAYATNSMGTGYGEVITFTTTTCESITLPYTETFEDYTAITTASTGIEPACWELVQDDVAMTASTRPQLYNKSTFAHSGSYSLKLHNRGVYAMPALSENVQIDQVHLEMYLRQANAAYLLQVGVWDDELQTFEEVQLFNNSTTNVEYVTCDFSGYTGNGRRIAFRNVLTDGAHYAYSYNYLDDITLTLITNRNVETVEDPNTAVSDNTSSDMANIDAPLSVEEFATDLVDITVYPNPTRDYINVQCTMYNVQSEVKAIEVIDVYGKVVRTDVETLRATSLPTRINVSGLAAGMYFVRVTTEEGTVTKPFVKR